MPQHDKVRELVYHLLVLWVFGVSKHALKELTILFCQMQEKIIRCWKNFNILVHLLRRQVFKKTLHQEASWVNRSLCLSRNGLKLVFPVIDVCSAKVKELRVPTFNVATHAFKLRSRWFMMKCLRLVKVEMLVTWLYKVVKDNTWCSVSMTGNLKNKLLGGT